MGWEVCDVMDTGMFGCGALWNVLAVLPMACE